MRLINHNEIKRIRTDRGLTQLFVADKINLSRPSYSLVESGLKDLTVVQLYALADVLGVSPQDLIAGSIGLSGDSFNPEKFKETILACINFGRNDDGWITKVKLAKLVYLCDFNWFYSNRDSITGSTYLALEGGPTPEGYFRIMDELFDDQAITIEPRGAALMISANEKQPPIKLNSRELELIAKICNKWKDLGTREIVDFTRAQAPYSRTNLKGMIDYKLILKESQNNLH